MKSLFLITFILLATGCKDKISGVTKNETIIQDPIVQCDMADDQGPTFKSEVIVSESGGSLNESPEISWNKANDNCSLVEYELALGTTLGGSDVVEFLSVGNVTNYQIKNIKLEYGKDYYVNVRAVDATGNRSAIRSSKAWQLWSPGQISKLVFWLEGDDLSSIQDFAGRTASDERFTGEVSLWKDIVKNSANLHNFSVTASDQRPLWSSLNKGLVFDGQNDFLTTPDHQEINLSIVTERTIIMYFSTSDDIDRQQVIYEEGDTSRGLNIYIEGGVLYCSFWNTKNDGDGAQSFIGLTKALIPEKKYTLTYELDYSNYTDASGVDGSLECKLNGISMGTVNTTSRLFPHSGDIGLGGMRDASNFHAGKETGDGFYFKGSIFDVIMFNSILTEEQHTKVGNLILASEKGTFPIIN